ncbi:MAG: hypothetical protein DBX59_03630 [Bacillota bacterium]|nr:MAG: hypothetical protein DBX59_03630 [Bacillota bacterium]
MLKIATDSCSNISMAEAKELGVELIPLTIVFGTDSYLDEVEMSKEDFYNRLVTEKKLPKTSQPSPEYFENLFSEAKKNGDEVLLITLSSRLSGTYETAVQAKNYVGYDKVCVYDSALVGECMKFLLLEAIKYKDLPLAAVVEKLDELKKRVSVYAVVDTLEYLHRGGRLSRSVAIIGALLNIKPIATMRDGVVTVVGKQRGVPKACTFIKELVEGEGIDENYPVYYGYALDNANCKLLVNKISPQPETDIANAKNLSPVIGAHIGPNCAYIMYVKKG